MNPYCTHRFNPFKRISKTTEVYKCALCGYETTSTKTSRKNTMKAKQ